MNGPEASSARRRTRILSVDDDEMNQLFIRELLGDSYDLMTVMDGEDALEVVNQFKPDIILLDVMMPGINGYDVCRAIRNTPNHDRLKIIFTSAKTRPKEREEGYAAGGNDYITKPFTYDELIGKVAIFAQIQAIEDERAELSRANVILRAHVRLLEFMNHARRNYSGSEELRAFSKALLREFMLATSSEAAMFLTTHKELGVQTVVLESIDKSYGVVESHKISDEVGVFADILMSYKPLSFSELNVRAESISLPRELGLIRTLLGMSFLVDEQIKGGIYLINKKDEKLFTEDEAELLESLIVEVEHVFLDRELI